MVKHRTCNADFTVRVCVGALEKKYYEILFKL